MIMTVSKSKLKEKEERKFYLQMKFMASRIQMGKKDII